jgi:hypothetical protein
VTRRKALSCRRKNIKKFTPENFGAAVKCLYWRPFAACPTKHVLCEILGSKFGEVGSIRGFRAVGLAEAGC